MDYAVVLYFDKESEKLLTEYTSQICEKGVNTYMLDMGIRPHITLAIFKDVKTDEIGINLQKFAKENVKFKLVLGSIGIFASVPGVVYLSPVNTEKLSAIHSEFYSFFHGIIDGYVPYYLPGAWVPHCTVANRLEKAEVVTTVDFLLDSFKPMEIEIIEIGFIECDPVEETCCCEIEKYDLGK